MSISTNSGHLRLRLLLPHGELPHWMGALLLALDQLDGVALQLLRVDAGHFLSVSSLISRLWRLRIAALSPWTPDQISHQRLAQLQQAAVGGCDVVFTIDAGLRPSPAEAGSGALQWALVDGDGRMLCRQFPLLASLCSGAGMQLALNQRESLSHQWQSQRKLHLGSTPQYGRALQGLSHAVQRLIQQASIDWLLGVRPVHTDASGDINLTDDAPISPRYPWCHGLEGYARALLTRLKSRLFSEYWRIGVIDAPVQARLEEGPPPAVRWLTPFTESGYWADPFGMPDDPCRLVCEYFDEHVGVGYLEVLGLDASARMSERIRLPVGAGRHTSFPNVFELDGRRLGIAEVLASRQCLLHEVDVDGHWHPLFPLVRDVSAADPALFRWDGRLWLAFTDTDMGKLDNLCLYHAVQLEGPWVPHANNPVKIDITGARMAGGFFQHNGALYRPAQNCLHTYGGAIAIHQVLTLTPNAFTEVLVRSVMPDAQGPCPDGLHTLNAWCGRTLVDGKRHGINRVALWRNFRHRTTRKNIVKPVPLSILSGSPESTPNHIFVYVPHLRTGGGEISMLRLAEGLAAAGLMVDLVVHSESTREIDVPPGIRLVSLNCGSTVQAVWRLAQLLRERQPQWMLSAFPHTNIAAVAAVALSGKRCRCVISEHAPLSLQITKQGNWRYRFLPPLVRWAYRRAYAVVAVSAGVRDDLKRMLGPDVDPLIISNPVLTDNFEFEMSQLPLDPWLTNSTLQVVLSVCRLSVEKDLTTLVRAFAEVHRKHPATRLILAGEGPDRPRLESLINELALGGVVSLPGRTVTPLSLMRHASVFVLASQYEGFGNVLIEAMACGTPVVSTDCPVGPREVLDGGRLGTLVPVGDVTTMAQGIAAALVRRTPLPGAREAALRFTQAQACGAYLQLFESPQASGTRC